MLEEAVKRNDSAIRAGRVELKQGDVASLPYPNEFFHKAMSIHSIYFWPDTAPCGGIERDPSRDQARWYRSHHSSQEK